MSEKEKKDLQTFAKKISNYCDTSNLKKLLSMLAEGKVRSFLRRGVHIPLIQIPGHQKMTKVSEQIAPISPLSPPTPNSLKRRQLRTAKLDLKIALKAMPREYKSLYYTALEADACCQDRDLHLLHYRKIYEERRHLALKKIRGWKLPKVGIAREQMEKTAESLKEGQKKRSHRHSVTDLSREEGFSEEERADKENLDLQNVGKFRRNYQSATKSIF